MASQGFAFLGVAEALLAFQAAAYPELGGPNDAESYFDAGNGYESRYMTLFKKILRYECASEMNLAVRGNDVGVPFFYDIVIETDDRVHFVCREAAIVHDGDDGFIGIVLGRPAVAGLVSTGLETSLADKIRVFTYLVRVSCKLIGSRGGVAAFGADAVGFFRDVVGVLRRLVGLAREQQGDDAGNGADAAEDDTGPVCGVHAHQSIREVRR